MPDIHGELPQAARPAKSGRAARLGCPRTSVLG